MIGVGVERRFASLVDIGGIVVVVDLVGLVVQVGFVDKTGKVG